ncbi:MAG TPA: Ig-like domain-containing protein, partial [Clostridia bacterium]|nr:Ig-like domain-containing protein [Clostridia bacterium]
GSNELFSAYFQGNRKHRYTLPETGTYRIRFYVAATNPQYVGDYAFRIYCDVYALPDQLALSPGKPLFIPKAKLLCNDTCEIGDTLAVDLLGTVSAQGGTLSETEGGILYTPTNGFTGMDTFTYRLRGQFGGQDIESVSIKVLEGADYHPTVVSLVRSGPTSVQVCLLGAPGQNYLVEESPDLTSWSLAGNLTADDVGSMDFVYNTLGAEKHFYRFRRP